MSKEITDSNLEETLTTDKLVVLDFTASWCVPCRMVGPIVDELHEKYLDDVVIGKVDVDSNSATSSKYGIRNVPTILFIKNGEIVDKSIGAVPKNRLEELILKYK